MANGCTDALFSMLVTTTKSTVSTRPPSYITCQGLSLDTHWQFEWGLAATSGSRMHNGSFSHNWNKTWATRVKVKILKSSHAPLGLNQIESSHDDSIWKNYKMWTLSCSSGHLQAKQVNLTRSWLWCNFAPSAAVGQTIKPQHYLPVTGTPAVRLRWDLFLQLILTRLRRYK